MSMSAVRSTVRLWRGTHSRLRRYRKDIVILGTARGIVALLCAFAGMLMQIPFTSVQHVPQVNDIVLMSAMLFSLLTAAPMRIETVRHLGGLTGVLDEDDRGFLNCSSKLWLWQRAAVLRLLWGMIFLCAWIPFLLLAMAAKVIWLTMPASGEELLPLLTVLHFLLLLPAAAWLPVRVCAAGTALPFSLLKMPQYSCFAQLRLAFRLTHRQTLAIILLRLVCLPALLLPFPAVSVLPTLLSSELLRYQREIRRISVTPSKLSAAQVSHTHNRHTRNKRIAKQAG